jgi:hypothetical protein
MTAFEAGTQARAAAARATLLATIARRRTVMVSAWTARGLLDIAQLLDTAASLLYEARPEADGIPTPARRILADAERTAAAYPGAGFPPHFSHYVTHVTPDADHHLAAAGCSLADEDARLAAALEILHGHLAAAGSEEVAQALVEAVLALHGRRADLARLVRG